MEQYLGTYVLSTQAHPQSQNYSEFHCLFMWKFFVVFGLLKSGSVHDFRIVLLSSLVTFDTNLDVIF